MTTPGAHRDAGGVLCTGNRAKGVLVDPLRAGSPVLLHVLDCHCAAGSAVPTLNDHKS